MRPLTVKEVAAIRRPGFHRVSRNLYVQVTATGTKSWLFRYMKDRASHGMGLGSLELVTLAEARDKALLCRKMLLDGKDPLEERRSDRAQTLLAATATMTFRECAKRYIEAHGKGWKNGKHRQQWRNTLETYAYPVIGELSVAAIDTSLIMQIVEPLWIGSTDDQGNPVSPKTETASRLRGRLESILDWATARNYRTGENPARWRGHLDQLLPKRSKVAPVKHHDALPYTEMPAFMVQLRSHAGVAARCLEFTILTATRTGEAIGGQWSEIDLAARTWKVPAERMKGGKEHTVPLSDRAIEILAAVPRSGDYVFENGRAGHPISNMAMAMTLRRMGRDHITVHGFRSSFRDWAAEQTQHHNYVVEMALAHTIGDKVEAAYRRGELLAKRRELMDDWERYCAGSGQRPQRGSGSKRATGERAGMDCPVRPASAPLAPRGVLGAPSLSSRAPGPVKSR
jgi:integrase